MTKFETESQLHLHPSFNLELSISVRQSCKIYFPFWEPDKWGKNFLQRHIMLCKTVDVYAGDDELSQGFSALLRKNNQIYPLEKYP